MAEGYGVSAVGGNRTSDISPEHKAAEFHPTPGGAGEALLAHYRAKGRPLVKAWECACGAGHLTKVLKAGGAAVLSTDLFDRGYGTSGQDFLKIAQMPAADCDVITNPPFSLAEEFIRHSVLDLKAPRTFLLLKSTYFHAAKRLPLWNECRPSWNLPLTFRLDFTGGGSPTMELSWFVWDAEDNTGECRVDLLVDSGGRAVKVRKPRTRKPKDDWDIL